MDLMEGIRIAEALVNRHLSDDEIEMVGRLVDAGRGPEAVLKLFDGYEPPPQVDEDGVAVWRYEPAGDQARQI